MRTLIANMILGACCGTALAGSNGWIIFEDETSSRLISMDGRGIADAAEKNFAVGDVDMDGDLDLAVMRKPESGGGCSVEPNHCSNILFMNEGMAEGHAIEGVLVNRTVEFASDADDGGEGFLDAVNSRDVVFVDVNGDGWLEMVTAAGAGDGLPKTLSHPRIYINKKDLERLTE